jgi:hypothetical protein
MDGEVDNLKAGVMAEERRLEEQIQRMKAMLEELGGGSEACSVRGINQTRAERTRLQSEVVELRAQVQSLEEMLGASNTSGGGADEGEGRGDCIRAAPRELAEQQLAESKRRMNRMSEGQHALQATEGALEKVAKDCLEENRKLEGRIQKGGDELEKRREAERKRKKERMVAMEEAMQSLVRLCVVAPTVNIHLANQSLDATPPLGVPMLPSDPANEIRKLVEDDILASFVTLFLQPGEGAAPPEVGGKLEEWLEVLLAELQQMIQVKLKAFVKQRKERQRAKYKSIKLRSPAKSPISAMRS